jgi:predicted DNA-binding transcriptional regulator AlpA
MTKYVSAADLARRYGVDRSTVWRWQARGILPAPIKISDQCTRWDLAAVERRDLERERDGQAA